MTDLQEPQVFGRRVISGVGMSTPVEQGVVQAVNTRTALWPERWPAIALQKCIDEVEAAAPAERAQVKRNLPCLECEKKTACLNAKRKEIGPLLYDREILTEPRSQESTLFPLSLFGPMLRVDLEMLPHYRKPLGANWLSVVSGWDLAWSEKVGGDALVRTTAVLDRRRNKVRLIDQHEYPQGLRYSQQIALIESDHGKYQEDLVVIESDAAQVIWSQSLEEQTMVPVMRHYASDKQDLKKGVPALLIDFDAQRWELPYKEDGRGYDQMNQMMAQFGAFGWNNGKLEGVGEHDDDVMSFYHCWWGVHMMAGAWGESSQGVVPGRA